MNHISLLPDNCTMATIVPTEKDVLIESNDASSSCAGLLGKNDESRDGNQTFQRFLLAVYDSYFKRNKACPRSSRRGGSGSSTGEATLEIYDECAVLEELASFTWKVWNQRGRNFLKKCQESGQWIVADEHEAKLFIKKYILGSSLLFQEQQQ